MKIATALTIISTAFFVAWTRHRLQRWERAIEGLELQLLEGESGELPLATQSWDDLPAVVQSYLAKALPKGTLELQVVRSLRVSQTGKYQSSPNSPWVAFNANQLISTNPPGFVWDATIAMTPYFSDWPSIQVCDAFVGMEGVMKAALLNVWEVPVMAPERKMETNADRTLLLGEAMRWLGEAFLVPSVLLPEEGVVVWESMGEHQALLRLNDDQLPEARLVITFDDATGWPVRAEGFRPKWLPDADSFETQTWIGRLDSFRHFPHENMWIPTRIRAGWQNPQTGQEEIYFDGHNDVYQFNVQSKLMGEAPGTSVA